MVYSIAGFSSRRVILADEGQRSFATIMLDFRWKVIQAIYTDHWSSFNHVDGVDLSSPLIFVFHNKF